MYSKKRVSRSRSSFLLRPSRDDTEESNRLKGRLRFKALVRRIIWSLQWVKEIGIDEGEVTQIATRAKTSKKGIPKEAKKILIKPPDSRTIAEQEELVGILGGLYFYNRYPKKEYEQLIEQTMYTSYGPGRIVLSQGQAVNPESRLYYVVQGHLSVEVATVDPITLVSTSEMIKKLGPGDQFGEVAILFNDCRESTVTTLTHVDLLCITKADFDAILKESLEKEWSHVLAAMNELPYFFGDWTDLELRRCSIISELKKFVDGDLILGDGFGKQKKAHFLMEGKCSIIQDLEVEEYKGKWKMVPTSKHLDEIKEGHNREEVYLQTSLFTKGACFGVGEKMDHRRYVAESDVVCLMVPQYLLLSHKRFDGYKQFLETRLFSENELFSSFMYSRSRLAYRAKVLSSVKKRSKSINNTTIWDVPHYYRVLAPQIGLCRVPDNVADDSLDPRSFILQPETSRTKSLWR